MGAFGRVADFFRGTLLSGGAQPAHGDFEDDGNYDDYDDYDYRRDDRYESRYDDDYDDEYESRGSKTQKYEQQQSQSRRSASTGRTSRNTGNVIDIHSHSAVTKRGERNEPVAQTISVKPVDMSEVLTLVEHLSNGRLLIVDVSRATPENTQRIADFMSGACQMAGGKIMRVNNGIFTIAPKNHNVSSDYFEDVDTDVQFFASAAR